MAESEITLLASTKSVKYKVLWKEKSHCLTGTSKVFTEKVTYVCTHVLAGMDPGP